MKCLWHCCNNIISVGSKKRKFCSNKCKSKYYVDKHRKNLKIKAVEYKGGKCEICGYRKSLRALVFHHRKNKSFGISYKGYTRPWSIVKKEIDKCDLLCSNCHAEKHDITGM